MTYCNNFDKMENATIQLYGMLVEEAVYGIIDLEGLKEEILKYKGEGAEIFWNPSSKLKVKKSNLDIVVMCENPDLLQFVIEEFVVKQNLNINLMNGDGETALDQAYKLTTRGLEKAQIVMCLRGYGAKTSQEIYEEQMLKNAQFKVVKTIDKVAQKQKNKEKYLKQTKNRERDR